MQIFFDFHTVTHLYANSQIGHLLKRQLNRAANDFFRNDFFVSSNFTFRVFADFDFAFFDFTKDKLKIGSGTVQRIAHEMRD